MRVGRDFSSQIPSGYAIDYDKTFVGYVTIYRNEKNFNNRHEKFHDIRFDDRTLSPSFTH